MDRRTVLAFVLIFLILVGSQYIISLVQGPSPETAAADSTAVVLPETADQPVEATQQGVVPRPPGNPPIVASGRRRIDPDRVEAFHRATVEARCDRETESGVRNPESGTRNPESGLAAS